MFYKEREKSLDLLLMESLKNRTNLVGKDYYYYLNLKKGFKGELTFDEISRKVVGNRLVLNDLLLQVNGKKCQIDSLVITSKSVSLYEIKNFEGEYIFKEDKVYHIASDKLVWNPFNQLDRADTLLHQLFEQLKIQLSIKSYVVFVNPKLTLYQAPNHPSLLLSSNLEKHLENSVKNTVPLTSKHKALASKLYELSLSETPHPDIPDYTYEQLKKGITCVKCGGFVEAITPEKGKYCFCKECGHRELVSETLDRHIDEYMRLFPERPITTIDIYNWCGGVLSYSRIRLHLQNRSKGQGMNRWKQYI